MFLSHNEDNLQFPKLVITNEMIQDYGKFMNCFMEEIYRIFFQEIFPRVFPEMKETLQLSPSKRIGDWFLSESETIIRLYVFVHQPYILQAFLTTRIFSLELFRQRIIV